MFPRLTSSTICVLLFSCSIFPSTCQWVWERSEIRRQRNRPDGLLTLFGQTSTMFAKMDKDLSRLHRANDGGSRTQDSVAQCAVVRDTAEGPESFWIRTRVIVMFLTVNFSSAFRPVCSKETLNQNSFLWSIEKANSTFPSKRSYFFGTIHVPYSKVWDFVSPATKAAFDSSDQVIFELDLSDRHTIQSLSRCQLLPPTQHLSQILPPTLFTRVQAHLVYVQRMLPKWIQSKESPVAGLYSDYLFSALTSDWQRKRPVWLLLLLNSLTETEMAGRGGPVLDAYLAQEAGRRNKRTGAVESVQEQCAPLNTMNVSQVLLALEQALDHYEAVRAGNATSSSPKGPSVDELVYEYNCGDLQSVIAIRDGSNEWMSAALPAAPSLNNSVTPSIDQYFRTELIQKRNRRMAQRVVELLETFPQRTFFFAFGAGHFLGSHSIIDLMKEVGYNVTHLSRNHHIKQTRLVNGRRKNRQKNVMVHPHAEAHTGKLILDDELDHRRREGKTGRRQKAHDEWRLLLNLPSDYGQQDGVRAAGRRRRPLLTTTTNRNFNELWIKQQLDTTPAPKSSPEPKNTFSGHRRTTPASNSIRPPKPGFNSAATCNHRSILFYFLLIFNAFIHRCS